MITKNHFHKKDFSLGLVLKQRLAAARKWPIREGKKSQLKDIKQYVHGTSQN